MPSWKCVRGLRTTQNLESGDAETGIFGPAKTCGPRNSPRLPTNYQQWLGFWPEVAEVGGIEWSENLGKQAILDVRVCWRRIGLPLS